MTEKELRLFSKRNRKRAWREFYPEGNGKAKSGYDLHHKDPAWQYEDPIRYAEWRHDDLVMLSHSEHSRLHSTLLKNHEQEEYRLNAVKEVRRTFESRKKSSEASLRMWKDLEFHSLMCNKMKEAQSRPETNQKRSESLKKTLNDPEHKIFIIERNKNPEFHKHRSNAQKKRYEDPTKKQKFKDAMNRPEVKEKFRGENNGMYGRHWATNGKENAVHKELPEGWWWGRTIKTGDK